MSDSSAPPMVTIEVDGQMLEAPAGSMLIETTDKAGIDIPRFCYHDKLSIAANCRMCLIEVENAPKPLPACATPVMDGMKVFTKSETARMAQKGTMEFLLVNHPLDCPICDQGGECELQDLALGYGRDISRFSEKKRVVKDKNIGPLVATDMTRCIHCTRCVRFSEEIAGVRELGATGRGENTEIGLYIQGAMNSELSGNVIDLCPVGALTSKPFRYKARAWELAQSPSIAPHDSVGSNIFIHSRRNEVMRVVPDRNEEINEAWISDRDRFSYQGVSSSDRLTKPRIKTNGQWRDVDWEAALKHVSAQLREVSSDDLGALASATSTAEELYLLQKLLRGLGSQNIDHRLRQPDTRGQADSPSFPSLGTPIAALENREAVLVIGSNIRKDLPIISHRLHKASNNGAALSFINPADFDFVFPVKNKIIASPAMLVSSIAEVVSALSELNGKPTATEVQNLCGPSGVSEEAKSIAQSLKDAGDASILIGALAESHPDYSVIQSLACIIASESGAQLGYLPSFANSAGACLAGVTPHRAAGAKASVDMGKGFTEMRDQGIDTCLLFGVEPEFDCDSPAATIAMLENAKNVISFHGFTTAALENAADVMLPISVFGETSGTFVNLQGDWQSFTGAVPPEGDSRPGWKVLRVLGTMLDLDGFEFENSQDVRDELRGLCDGTIADNKASSGNFETRMQGGLTRLGDVPLYSADALVRRSSALQATSDSGEEIARVSPAQAAQLGISDGATVVVSQGDLQQTMSLMVDSRVPESTVWLSAATPAASALGAAMGSIQIAQGSSD